jgi:hypothetical protein
MRHTRKNSHKKRLVKAGKTNEDVIAKRPATYGRDQHFLVLSKEQSSCVWKERAVQKSRDGVNGALNALARADIPSEKMDLVREAMRQAGLIDVSQSEATDSEVASLMEVEEDDSSLPSPGMGNSSVSPVKEVAPLMEQLVNSPVNKIGEGRAHLPAEGTDKASTPKRPQMVVEVDDIGGSVPNTPMMALLMELEMPTLVSPLKDAIPISSESLKDISSGALQPRIVLKRLYSGPEESPQKK